MTTTALSFVVTLDQVERFRALQYPGAVSNRDVPVPHPVPHFVPGSYRKATETAGSARAPGPTELAALSVTCVDSV